MSLFTAEEEFQIEKNTERHLGMKEGLEKGLEQGLEQGIKQTAVNMLKGNIDIETIIKYTKLTEEEILKLKKEINK